MLLSDITLTVYTLHYSEANTAEYRDIAIGGVRGLHTASRAKVGLTFSLVTHGALLYRCVLYA